MNAQRVLKTQSVNIQHVLRQYTQSVLRLNTQSVLRLNTQSVLRLNTQSVLRLNLVLRQTPPLTQPQLSMLTVRSTPLSPGASGEGQQRRTDSCTAIGGGLGALAAVLALTLVGVVLGWVWHCRRNKGKANIQR